MASVNLPREPDAIGGEKFVNRADYQSHSHRIASRRLTRAITLLTRAGRQLDNASRLAPDKYNADRLRFFAIGIRDLSLPLSRIASRLEKGGAL
jgi:hypothetical protein